MYDDDGWMPEHGYTISSPGEPSASGELKIKAWMSLNFSWIPPLTDYM